MAATDGERNGHGRGVELVNYQAHIDDLVALALDGGLAWPEIVKLLHGLADACQLRAQEITDQHIPKWSEL